MLYTKCAPGIAACLPFERALAAPASALPRFQPFVSNTVPQCTTFPQLEEIAIHVAAT